MGTIDRLLATGARDDSDGDGRSRHARQSRDGEAVVIVDVDQFASIRTRHGSAAAEQVTRAVADSLRRRLRVDDRLALLRDDEFLAVLRGAPAETLPSISARLSHAVESLRLALAGSVWGLSCTIGVAARGSRPCPLESLVRAADSDLHRSRCAQAERRGA